MSIEGARSDLVFDHDNHPDSNAVVRTKKWRAAQPSWFPSIGYHAGPVPADVACMVALSVVVRMIIISIAVDALGIVRVTIRVFVFAVAAHG